MAVYLSLMNTPFNLENLIIYLKSKKRTIFLLAVIFSILITAYAYFFKLNVYNAQVKFYITNSEAIDQEAILNKSIIDFSVERQDLSRLKSFGYSNIILLNILDSIKNSKNSFNPLIIKELEDNNPLYYLAEWYKVKITDLGEIEVTAKHKDAEFANFLCHQIMNGINAMNNKFLAEFKKEQIIASERQIELLNQEKKIIYEKIDTLSSIIKETNYLANIKNFERSIKSKFLSNKEVQQYIIEISSPKKLELNMLLYKINNIDASIESFNRTLNNDRWSIELLKKKKPFMTQDKPVLNNYSPIKLVSILFCSFIILFFALMLAYALYLRYQQYIKLIFSK